jgi:hypothetical protein
MRKTSNHPLDPDRTAGAKDGQNLPGISDFVRNFRDYFYLWANEKEPPDLPPKYLRDRFIAKWVELSRAKTINVLAPKLERFNYWWRGDHLPRAEELKVICLILRGSSDPGDERCAPLWRHNAAANPKTKRRAKPTQRTDDDSVPLASQWRTRQRKSQKGNASIAKMVVDLVGLLQNKPEEGFPVVLDLSFGFDNDLELPCKVYLKQCYVKIEIENGGEIPKTFFEGRETPGMRITREGDRWIFIALDGGHLTGKPPEMDQLVRVKPDLDAEAPLSVKLTAFCPGRSAADHVAVMWDPTDAETDEAKKAVMGRFAAKCVDGRAQGAINLGWVAVDLIEKT